MSDWQIKIPYRSRDDSLIDLASNARALESDEDRAVVRQLALAAHLAASQLKAPSNVGFLLDTLDETPPGYMRKLLDACRVKAGLPTTAAVEAQTAPPPPIVRAYSPPQVCAEPDCDTQPTHPDHLGSDAARREALVV